MDRNQKIEILYDAYKKSDYDVDFARVYLKEAIRLGSVRYLKPLDSFNKRDYRDLFAHVALHHYGIDFTVRDEDAPDGFSNIDLEIDGYLWEIKSPTARLRADGRLKFVESNVLKTIDQFKRHYPAPVDKVRLIFSNAYTELNDSAVLTDLKRELNRRRIEECYYVGKLNQVEKLK